MRLRSVLEGPSPPDPEGLDTVARGSQWIAILLNLQSHEREMARLGFAVVMLDSPPFQTHHPPLSLVLPDSMNFKDLMAADTYWSWYRFVGLRASEDTKTWEGGCRDIERLADSGGFTA